MPGPLRIDRFGGGRNTRLNASQLAPSQARDSLNLTHGDPQSARPRLPVDRTWATRPNGAAATLAAWELIKPSGPTTVLLAKQGDKLYLWSLTPGTALVQLLSGMDATHIPGVANAGGYSYVTDHQAANYITNGTAARSHVLQKTGPTGTPTLGAGAATVTGNVADTISYSITDLDPDSGEETPPGALVSRLRVVDKGIAITGLTYTADTYTSKRIYRDVAGTSDQPYYVTTLVTSASTFRARATNVATITTAAAHGLQVGQAVTTTGFGGVSYNASFTVASVPTTTTFTYTNVAADEGSTADTGGVITPTGYLDDSLDTSLTTVSTVHDEFGSASIDKPAGAKFACFHRGRMFFANFSGLPTRLRWSRNLEPTQWEVYTDALMDVGKNDGGEITGLVSFRGALVILKSNSIWVMNGDIDEANFTFYPAVTGRGCIAPWTIRRDGDTAIYFLSACGVMSFDLSGTVLLSDDIHDDVCCLNVVDRSDFFVAGVDVCERQYQLSVSPAGVTTNTKTHVLNIDTGVWGRIERGMNQIVPTCYSDTGDVGPIHNATGSVKLYVGDTAGYLYETDSTTAVGDGVTAGTVAATVTSLTSTTTTCSAATFRTTGDQLKGLPFTKRSALANAYETVLITSNTGTVVTHPAWSVAAVAGDTVYIGAYQCTLSLGRVGGAATAGLKRWVKMSLVFEKEASFTYYLRAGYTLDADTAPTATTEIAMSSGFRASVPIQRRAMGLSPYFDIIGPIIVATLILIEIEVIAFDLRRPTRAT